MSYYKDSPQMVTMQNQPPPPPGMPVAWMNRPAPFAGCPAGLEYLTLINSLKVKQVPSLLEAFTGWDTNNKYEIQNSAGQRVYFAAEDTDACMRVCCQERRGFQINIIDNLNTVVMRLSREFKCCAGCCWFAGTCDDCAHEVMVEAPIGNIIGYVRQTGSFWKASYDIKDENHETVLKIGGPCCILDGPFCPFDNDFIVYNKEETLELGKISKQYAGFIKEAFTTADNFGISFPGDLSVKVKGTLIAALFLIDFMFFEKKQQNDN